jgi:hypothetical protein
MAIDEALARLFLETMQPPELELGLAVLLEAERQAGDIDRQWKLRLDRARYEACLAERRYKSVDPDNRVVARTLEREWNDKLGELQEIEHERDIVRRREKVVLSDEDRARILALAKDLPRVWNAASTTNAERKNLLRMLVREVTLTPIDVPSRMTRLQVLWQTGAVTELTVARRSKFDALATPDEALELIRKLFSEKKNDAEIADELNRQGLRTGFHRPWDGKAIKWVRSRVLHLRRLPVPPQQGPQPDRRRDGLYSVRGVANRFGVTDHIVRYWVNKGWLEGAEGGGHRVWWFKLDRATVKRLEAAKASGYGPGGRRHSQTRVRQGVHHA